MSLKSKSLHWHRPRGHVWRSHATLWIAWGHSTLMWVRMWVRGRGWHHSPCTWIHAPSMHSPLNLLLLLEPASLLGLNELLLTKTKQLLSSMFVHYHSRASHWVARTPSPHHRGRGSSLHSVHSWLPLWSPGRNTTAVGLLHSTILTCSGFRDKNNYCEGLK